MRRAAGFGLAALWLASAACSRGGGKGQGAEGGDAGVTLAQVNDARLTAADLKRSIPPEFQEAVTGPEVRDVLDGWVRTELLYQKAKHDGLDRDADVAARLHARERELLADALLQRELEARVHVTNAEVQAYYEAHLPEYTVELHLEHILVNTRDEAEALLAQLRAGVSFESLAKLRSQDETAAQGGDLGYLGRDGLNPAFTPYVFNLHRGEVYGPIASSFGFHVVKLLDRRDAAERPSLEAARDEIMHNLLLAKQQKAQEDLLKELRARAKVQIASTYAGMSLARADSTPRAAAPPE